MRSIERHLALWILGAAGLGTLLLGGVAYWVVLDELNQALDDNLHAVALAVAHRGPMAPAFVAHDADGADIVVVERTASGQVSYTSDAGLPLRPSARSGFERQRLLGTEWDVYALVGPDRSVQAAQRAAFQQQEAAEVAAKLFVPFALVFGLVAAMLVLALRRGLAPLDRTAADVAARSASSLEPIDTASLPREITPLVLALNNLMRHVSDSLELRQRFVADAAHELRTPITALKLQLQLLRSTPDEAAQRRAQDELQAGIDRAQHLVEQLLELSRAEPGNRAEPQTLLELAPLARSAVGRFSPRAESLGLDLGARILADGALLGNDEALRVLLDNLIGNALRFTPRGGVVDVEVADVDGCAMLRVIDDGPGIAVEERALVFERFRRAHAAAPGRADEQGSGLGLAIVKAVAEGHGARVTLHDGHGGRGLEVRVMFPRPGGSP